MSDFNINQWAEIVRPVQSDATIIDKDGNNWRQVSGTGWLRAEDNFFWPFNPTTNNIINKFPPTIEEVKSDRIKSNI